MATEMAVVGADKITNINKRNEVELKCIWEDHNVVVIFFRRWGCLFSRLWAIEVSKINNILKDNDIKLVGVGIEEIGAKEFVDGHFFNGDLYYVNNISTYDTLGFKKFSILSILATLIWKQSRQAINKGRDMGIECNLIGDSLQNGGALLLKKGGNIVKHFIQICPADSLSNKEILEAFDVLNDSYIRGFCETDYYSERRPCKVDSSKSLCMKIIHEQLMAPIHNIWNERRCNNVFSTKV